MAVEDYNEAPFVDAGAAQKQQHETHKPLLESQQKHLVDDKAANEPWSTKLFDFGAQPGGPSLQWVSCCLPWVQYATLSEQLPKGATCLAGSFGGAAAAYMSLEVLSVLSHCFVVPGISLVPMSACLNMKMRKHLREKYNIEGDWKRDLCVSWCCAPCALAQQTREVIIRNAAEQEALKQQSQALLAPSGPQYMFGNLMLPPPGYAGLQAMGMPVPASNMAAAPPATTVAVVGLPQQYKDGYEPHTVA